MANKVGSGVFPGIKERFKLFRGILNTNPKTAPEASKDLTPEEKIQALATAVFGTSSEYATRQSLVEGLNAKEEAYRNNPTDALKDEIETERKQLELFDETITKLKQAAVAEKAAEENKLYKAVTDSEKMVDGCVTDFYKNIDTLLESIKKDEKTNIYVMVQAVARNFTDYNARLKTLEEKIQALKDYTGKDDYVSSHKKMYLSEEQVEKIYRGLRTQIKDLTQMGFGLNSVLFNKKKYIREYEEFFLLLPKLLGDPEKFKAIKDKVDAELKIEQKDPAEELIKEAKEKIDSKLAELFEQYKAEIKQLELTIDKMRVMGEVSTIVDEYDGLTKKQKEELIDYGLTTFKKKVNAEYNPELRAAIKIAVEINDLIEELAEIEYTDPRFTAKYQFVIDEIKLNRDSDVFNKIGAVIILDEKNQKVHFIFKSDKVNDLSINIVPEKVKEQMKRKPAPATEPHTQAPTEDEPKEAIAAYLELLKELKEEITKLNYCNSNIEAAASVTFDNIDADKVNTVTAMEKVAMQHDTNILQKKLELSNARANLRIKYNCYVSAIPEINNYQMPSIEFGKDYKSFVRYYDEMITIAETKIKELDKERMADYTPLERANDLTDEMKKIVSYIEAVNSLINRRIIAASLEEDIDIVAFLQERRENKKVIRQEIKEMLERQLASRPEVNQEEAEQQLTAALREIYDQWLQQFKLSLSSNTIVVDDKEFENRISEAVTKSQAKRKYEIANDFKNQFKRDQEELLLVHYDETTQFEISEVLREQIIPVMKEIRNGAEYDENNLEALCINQETQEKLNAIMARSQSARKFDILATEKNNYLTQIQDIVAKEQIISRRAFDKSVQETQEQVEALEINDDFIFSVKAKYEVLIVKYKDLIKNLEINYNIENNNSLTIRYVYKNFTGKLFGNEIARIELKAMSPEKYAEYLEYQKGKGPKPTPSTDPVPETEPEKDQQGPSELDIRVNNSKYLKFNSINPQHVQRLQGKIMTADSIQLTLLKNGLKIKYSENLRNQLKELNARLSLVNKNNYRSRTTTEIDPNEEEQFVTFKKKGLEINPEDYRIEIRTDKYNKNGTKAGGSELLYSMDIDEELAEELRPKKL